MIIIPNNMNNNDNNDNNTRITRQLCTSAYVWCVCV